MAFEVTGLDDRSAFRGPIKTYDCTSVDDIAKLPRRNIPGTQVLNDGRDVENNAPCSYGSIAFVKGGGTYKLWPDNQWASWS